MIDIGGILASTDPVALVGSGGSPVYNTMVRIMVIVHTEQRRERDAKLWNSLHENGHLHFLPYGANPAGFRYDILVIGDRPRTGREEDWLNQVKTNCARPGAYIVDF